MKLHQIEARYREYKEAQAVVDANRLKRGEWVVVGTNHPRVYSENGKLISASPNLLTALSSVLDMISSGTPNLDTVINARAAIAKARP